MPIRIAVPGMNSRLHEVVLGILGLPSLTRSRVLARSDHEAVVYLVRGWDVPRVIDRGLMDVGFCGLDAIVEHQSRVTILEHFHPGYTKIALCTLPEIDLSPGRKLVLATEYPAMTRAKLGGRYDLELIHVHGAAEAYAFVPGVDGVVDLVDSGETLRQNGLCVRETLLEISLSLVARTDREPMPSVAEIISRTRSIMSSHPIEGAR